MTKCSIWSKTISDFWMRSNSTFPTYSEEAWFHGSQPKDIHDSESHWSCKTSWIRDDNFRWELLRRARDRKERCIYKNPLRWNTWCRTYDFCTRFFCISKRENRESRWNDYSTLIPYKNVSKKPQVLRFFFFFHSFHTSNDLTIPHFKYMFRKWKEFQERVKQSRISSFVSRRQKSMPTTS